MTDKTRRVWLDEFNSVIAGADSFDQFDWYNAIERVPQLDELNERTANEFAGDPAQDAFLTLYRHRSKVSDSPPKGTEPLASLLKRAMDTPRWQEMQEHTRGEIMGAAFGTRVLVEKIFRDLPEEVKEAAQEHQAQAQAQADQEQRADNLEGLAEMFREQATGNASGEVEDGQELTGQQQAQLDQADQWEEQAGEIRQQAADMQAAVDEALANFEEVIDQHDARIKALCNQVAEEAADETEEVMAFVRGFSEAAGGDPQQVSADAARLAMAAMLGNEHLKDLADQLGWAQRVVKAERRMSPHGGHDFTGFQFGPLDVGKMAGQEMVALAADEDTGLHWDIMRRVMDSAVLIRQFEGDDDEQGRGTMFLVRDESGSMAGAPHSLAVAVEWALLNAARKDKRDFYSVPFSGQGQFEVWKAPDPGRPDPQGLLAHLEHFYCGGTEPYGPLAAALEIIEKEDLRADILVITDASFAQPSQDFLDLVNEVRERIPVRIEVVMIGDWGGSASVDRFADRVHHVSDLVQDRDMLKAAFQGMM